MRNDGVSKLYKPSQIMDKINKWIFALNIICVALSCILSGSPLQLTRILQIVFSLAFVLIEILDDGVFWFNAENIRRTNCIENAFQVNLSEYKTEGYYNNDFEPSFDKYLINTFESNFFTTNISQKMLAKKIAVALVELIMFVISCLCVSPEIVVIITEAVFSSVVMIDAVSLVIYAIRMKQLYCKAYTQLISIGTTKPAQFVWAISYIMEYESIKAHYKIRLDTKKFEANNLALSNEWNRLKKEIVIQENK